MVIELRFDLSLHLYRHSFSCTVALEQKEGQCKLYSVNYTHMHKELVVRFCIVPVEHYS